MGCLGVHLALTEEEVRKLKSFPTDEERLEYLQEELEEEYFADHPEWLAQTDKAWDAIHRALTDGGLDWDNGVYPLSHVIMGGEILYSGDDYIMSLKSAEQVQDIARELEAVTERDLRAAYFRIDSDECGYSIDEQDWEYTRHWFDELRPFYARAASASRYVLFTADQ